MAAFFIFSKFTIKNLPYEPKNKDEQCLVLRY